MRKPFFNQLFFVLALSVFVCSANNNIAHAKSEPIVLGELERIPGNTGRQNLLALLQTVPMARNVQRTEITSPDYYAYVLYDPTCRYSMMLYKNMEGIARDLNIQFNWIPLTFNQRAQNWVSDIVRSVRSANKAGVEAVRASMEQGRGSKPITPRLSSVDKQYGELGLQYIELLFEVANGLPPATPSVFIEDAATKHVMWGYGIIDTPSFKELIAELPSS